MTQFKAPFRTNLFDALDAAVNTHTKKGWSQRQFAPDMQVLKHAISITYIDQAAALTALVCCGRSVKLAQRELVAFRDEAARRIQMKVDMAKLDAFALGVQIHQLAVPCHSPVIGMVDDEGLQVDPNDPVLPVHEALMASCMQQIVNWNALKAYMAAHCPSDGHWTTDPASVFNSCTEEGEAARRWVGTEVGGDSLPDMIESLTEPDSADTDLCWLLLYDLRRAAMMAMVVQH
jgi:hypothetical protein